MLRDPAQALLDQAVGADERFLLGRVGRVERGQFFVLEDGSTGANAAGLHVLNRVRLASHEGDERPSFVLVLGRGRDRQVPAGQGSAVASGAGRRRNEGNLVSHGRGGRVGDLVGQSGRVEPHRGLAGDEGAERFLVRVGAHVGRRALEQVNEVLQGLDGLRRGAGNDFLVRADGGLIHEARAEVVHEAHPAGSEVDASLSAHRHAVQALFLAVKELRKLQELSHGLGRLLAVLFKQVGAVGDEAGLASRRDAVVDAARAGDTVAVRGHDVLVVKPLGGDLSILNEGADRDEHFLGRVLAHPESVSHEHVVDASALEVQQLLALEVRLLHDVPDHLDAGKLGELIAHGLERFGGRMGGHRHGDGLSIAGRLYLRAPLAHFGERSAGRQQKHQTQYQ